MLAAAAIAAGGDGGAAQKDGFSTIHAGAGNSAPDANAKESNGHPCHAPCDHCAAATPAAELLLCLGCHHARYCSTACQRGAWFVCFCEHVSIAS